MKHRMFLAVLLSLGLVAVSRAADAPVPPVVPAGDTPAPLPPKAEKKKSAAKKSATKKPAEPAREKTPSGATKLANPEPAVAKQNNINVRGQAKLQSEIVAHLKKGDRVTLLEEIATKKKQDEPDRWYKIALPSNVAVWTHSSFIDANKTVIPKKLNLRAGPGENYSILGQLEKGATVNVVETKGDWSKIEPPASAYGFVAAHLLSREPADIAASAPAIVKTTPPAPVVLPPPPPATTIAAPPVIAPPAEVTTPAKPEVVVTPPPPPSTTSPLVLTPVPAPPEETLVKRVVTREGIVKGSASIQAPTYFVLCSLDNNRTINYLHSPSTNIVVREFRNQRVLISGEEMLDERWPNTPVIEIESIQAVKE